MISFSVLNEKWTRKITNHYKEKEKIKKVRKSLVTSGFFKNPVISFSVLRATVIESNFKFGSIIFLLFSNILYFNRDDVGIVPYNV